MGEETTLINLVRSGKRYHEAVKAVFAIDPKTKKCFAEGSPTQDEETYQRFVEFNEAGKRFSAALCAADRQVPA
jgi:hypothetical protein